MTMMVDAVLYDFQTWVRIPSPPPKVIALDAIFFVIANKLDSYIMPMFIRHYVMNLSNELRVAMQIARGA